MLEIKNTEVWGLERAIIASGNAKRIGEINTIPVYNPAIISFENEFAKDIDRSKKLGCVHTGTGHDHYLLGIHVQFDIKYPQYWTIEAERYHNFEIITSQSKMHKLTAMASTDMFNKMFNEFVDDSLIEHVKLYIKEYNHCIENNAKDMAQFYFMKAISNLPLGFEMWMTCDLTYLQIKTMVTQRMNHKLPDWKVFCDWAYALPRFKELTGL